jgi:hypothetical protein
LEEFYYNRASRPENLEVETEEVDKDGKGPYILYSKVVRTISEMRDKKTTGDVPGDLHKLL